jgi:diazepam-binding inhibitor (GABA receptor modulating acyl-CoA-binding protein)
MDIQQQFGAAVASSKTLNEKPGNDVLLELYSLYKQSTEGDAGEGPSNGFDFVAKFKHEAWLKLSGMSRESAMQRYVDLVHKLKG